MSVDQTAHLYRQRPLQAQGFMQCLLYRRSCIAGNNISECMQHWVTMINSLANGGGRVRFSAVSLSTSQVSL